MGKRVTVQVESNFGEDGPLTLADTLRQLIDAFDLLGAAIQGEAGTAVQWRLISLSKNSPATATAEAFSDYLSAPLEPLIRRGERQFSEGIEALERGVVVPWLEPHTNLAKTFLQRNLDAIGRTIFDFDDAVPRAVIVEKNARSALATIERYEAEQGRAEPDMSRSERGTIDANVCGAKTYRGRPALYVRDRISGKEVPCVLNERAAEEAGPTHSWSDTWGGKRVRIKGEIFYDRRGGINRVHAVSVQDVTPQPISLGELRSIDLTIGKPPADYLDELWGYSDE